ncbi:MAG TPA: tetratricopeptide repeat protein [Saprospiraceae bacterium]|nr:tetratricopeptide repeat protein [Saprospiraceae bacterium]
MKHLVLILWLFYGLFGVKAQSLDSLTKAIPLMPEDSHRVMALRALYRGFYAAGQDNQLLGVAEEGLALSRKIQFMRGVELFLFYKASALDIAGRGQEAIPVFDEGLALAQKIGKADLAADFHINLGTAHQQLGNSDKALHNYLAAYEYYKKSGQLNNLSKVLNNIGIIYRNQNKYDRAEAIYKESIQIKLQLKDSLGLAAGYQNLASLLSQTDRMEEAIATIRQSLSLYNQLNREEDVAGCYSSLGQIYFNFNRLPEARQALQKALDGFKGHKNVDYAATTYYLLGILAAREQNHPAAQRYLQTGLTLAREFGQKKRLIEILPELSKSESALGNYAAALAHLQEAYQLRDSVTEQNRLALMEEMQTKFDVVQKDNELKINQLELRDRTRERNALIAGAMLLGVMALAIFLGLQQRIRANKKIAEQESALQQQQILQLEQESRLNSLKAMIEGQEQERSRIAADLHDGLGGLLTSVKSHFNALPYPPEQEIFGKTNRLIDEACGEVRRISHNMMPRALSVSGLSGALEDLCEDLTKQGLSCQLELLNLDNYPLAPTLELTLYRILQELSTNVIKHAQATHLLMQLIRDNQQLTVILEDDGCGFDVSKALLQKGLGLSSIQSRVQYLHGTIEWDSVPQQGTQVTIQVPIM